MRTMKSIRATDICGELSEGPYWDAPRERLLWVDITGGVVHAGLLSSGRIAIVNTWDFPTTVGAVACSTDGYLLVAQSDVLSVVSPQDDRRMLARVLPSGSGRRLNDAGIDPKGRPYVGTLSLEQPSESEELLLLEDGMPHVVDGDLTLSNGIAWSPDGRRMLTVDSLRRTVFVRDYDPSTASTGPRQTFVSDFPGVPDGICTDTEGGLWVAVWGAGRVHRYDEQGNLDAVVLVDAPHVSSVAFAGADLRTLVITTARHDLSPQDLDANPASGALFTAEVGVTGTPVAAWLRPIREGEES
jgi:sugar lactone lactonase YvrE